MVQGDKLIYGYNDRENALLCSYVRKYGENSEEERIIARCEQGDYPKQSDLLTNVIKCV